MHHLLGEPGTPGPPGNRGLIGLQGPKGDQPVFLPYFNLPPVHIYHSLIY